MNKPYTCYPRANVHNAYIDKLVGQYNLTIVYYYLMYISYKVTPMSFEYVLESAHILSSTSS